MLINRRRFLGLGGAAVLGLGLYSGEFERHHLEVQEHMLTLRGLADSFHGMRIAQISDFHYDEFTEPFFIRTCVDRVNALKPDLVLLTGDFVTHALLPRSIARRHCDPCAALVSGLDCPLRYAVMGNHDADVGTKFVTGALEAHGIPVLENKYVPLERAGGRLWIAGVGNVTHRMARLELAVPPKRMRGNDPVVLMAHEPDFANHVAQYGGVDFMVSGHTHGGQVRLPLVGPVVLPKLGKRYVEGFFQVGPTRLYVNRGIGTVGVPLRFDCRPEITVFTMSAG